MLKMEDFARLKDYRRRIAHLRRRIAQLREQRTSLSVNMDGMPHGSSGDSMAEYVAALDELERTMETELLRLEALEVEITAALDALPAQQGRVMRMRYVEGMPWKAISVKTGYCDSHCRKIRDAAVRNITGGKA